MTQWADLPDQLPAHLTGELVRARSRPPDSRRLRRLKSESWTPLWVIGPGWSSAHVHVVWFPPWQGYRGFLSVSTWSITLSLMLCFLFSKTLVLLWPFVLEVSLFILVFFKWLFIYLFCPVCSSMGWFSRPGIEPSNSSVKAQNSYCCHLRTYYSLQRFSFFGRRVVRGVSRRLEIKWLTLLCLMKTPLFFWYFHDFLMLNFKTCWN